MARELEIRKVEIRDSEGLTSLYKSVYGADFSREYWEWKYFKNPHGENMMYIALDNGKVVGEVGTIPVKVKCGDKTYLGSQTCDITILPEYQKGGPFLKLYKKSNEENVNRGGLLIYGFSVPVTLKISSKLLKFRPLCPVWRWVLVLNPAPYLAKKLHLPVLSSLADKPGRTFVKLRLMGHLKKKVQNVIEVDRFDTRFDQFWEERKKDYGVMVARDSAYLNWRYKEFPLASYKTLACIENGKVKGFSVLCIKKDEVRRGLVLELMAEQGNGEVLNCLISAAINYFSREKADVVTLWMSEHDWMVKHIEKLSFAKLETQHHLIVKPLFEDKAPIIMDTPNWHFSMGDSDYH